MAEFTWFFLAVIGPFLYALTNHIDKHLLSTYFREGGVPVLIIYSALLSICVLPVALWVDPSVLSVDTENAVVLGGVAVIDVILLWAYLTALSEDEPTVVIIYYQLIPVLGLGLGYFILGETITEIQLVAMAIIIGGALFISFEMNEKGIVFKKRTAGLMLIACTCWALEMTIFKKVALEENVWRSLFWECLVLSCIGIGLITLVPKYRNYFFTQFKKNSAAVVSLNVVNEGLYIVGNLTGAFAAMLAPVALVLLINCFQPMFVLVIGILIAVFFPKLATEKHTRRGLAQKVIAIAITGAGTYLLL